MIVLTKVPYQLYKRIVKEGSLYAKTNWEDDNKKIAYEYLKNISKMDNFFFGIVKKGNPEPLQELVNSLDDANETLLELDIPDNLCYVHDYYALSDLIYYTSCEPNEKIEKSCVKDLKKVSTSDCLQVIYPYIKKEFILNVTGVIEKNVNMSGEELVELMNEKLVGKKIASITDDKIKLEDGFELLIDGNEGCGGCYSGWSDLLLKTKNNTYEAAIMNVVYKDESGIDDDKFKIFIYLVDQTTIVFDGDEGIGNGYYGSGFWITIKV